MLSQISLFAFGTSVELRISLMDEIIAVLDDRMELFDFLVVEVSLVV